MWKLKVLTQFILARVPFGERLNYLLQLAKGSHSPRKVKRQVIETLKDVAAVNRAYSLEGLDAVEIGTGWTAIGAFGLYLFGAKSVVSYDHVPHLRYELARQVLELMELSLEEISAFSGISKDVLLSRLQKLKNETELGALLAKANIRYVAPGDASITGLPAASVDLIYSFAVFEHVPVQVLHNIAEEAKRILRPSGSGFHTIGLGDHYANGRDVSGVNFLRYSPGWWRFWVHNNIAHHNRLREKQFVDLFKSHGCPVEVVSNIIPPADLAALKKIKVHSSFAGMTDEELAVWRSTIRVRPAAKVSQPTQEAFATMVK